MHLGGSAEPVASPQIYLQHTHWMVLFISHCGEQTPVQEVKIRSSTDSVPPDWDETLPGGCCREHGALHGCSFPVPGRTKLDCVTLSWNGSERAGDEDVKRRRREGQQIIGHTYGGWNVATLVKNGIEGIIRRRPQGKFVRLCIRSAAL